MSQIKIEISEPEVRVLYEQYLKDKARLMSIGEIVSDHQFKEKIIDSHLGLYEHGRLEADKGEIPVSIHIK